MTRAASDQQKTVPVLQPTEPTGPTFACAQCNKYVPLKGRLFRRVRKGMARGLRAYVCAGCGA